MNQASLHLKLNRQLQRNFNFDDSVIVINGRSVKVNVSFAKKGFLLQEAMLHNMYSFIGSLWFFLFICKDL